MTPDSGPILLVEQASENANAIKHAFEELRITNPLVHFGDGEQALVHLRQHAEKSPWLILLSLGTAETKGIAFLKALKSDDALKSIPIIVMASSYHQDTITQCFGLGVAGYMVNTGEYGQLDKTIRAIVQYWTLCAWPPNDN